MGGRVSGLKAFFQLKFETMFSGGKENFQGRKIPAFYPEKRTGSGESRFPGDAEMPAPEAVGSLRRGADVRIFIHSGLTQRFLGSFNKFI